MADFLSREKLAGYNPDTLARSRVLLAGVGAAGSNAAQNLALIGIGELWLSDPDFAEPSNLTRSPLLAVADAEAKRDKVEVAAQALASISRARSGVIRYAPCRVEELGNGAIEAADVVLSFVDNDKTRGYLACECRLLGKPFIEVGFRGPQVNISVYPNLRPKEPCFLCLNPEASPHSVSCRLWASELEEQGRTPAIQPAAALVAGLAAEAAVMALHGEFPLGSSQIYFNMRHGRFSKVKLAQSPGCSGPHRLIPPPVKLEVTAEEPLEHLLEAAGRILPDPVLTLPSPFVLTAACPNCGRQQYISLPVSNIRQIPCCGRCDADKEAPSGTPLEIYSQASAEEAKLLGISSRVLGIGPNSVIEAGSLTGDDTVAIQLAGTVEDIFPHYISTDSRTVAKKS